MEVAKRALPAWLVRFSQFRYLDRVVSIINVLLAVVLIGNLGYDLWSLSQAQSRGDILDGAGRVVEFILLTFFVLLLPLRLEKHGKKEAALWIRRLTALYGVSAFLWVLYYWSVLLVALLPHLERTMPR